MPSKEYPRRIFIESSLLFQLGPRLENVEFANLLETGRSVKCELYASEVSWMEYLRERKREFRKHLESSLAIQKTLEHHGKSIPEHGRALGEINTYLKNIDAHYRTRAAERGIAIVPLPDVDLNRLLRMSIECIPPFEDPESKTREKGFRDALIMFSILEALRGKPGDNALVITNDRLLAEGLELHREEYDTRLRVARTFGEAAAIIAEAITEAERSRLKAEMELAVEMLMCYHDEISSKVQEIKELTDWELGQSIVAGLYGDLKKEYVDIRSLESVSFDMINSAVWKEKDKLTSRILFACRCNAHVVANAPHLRVFSDQSRRHRVGQNSQRYLVSYVSGMYDVGPTEKKTLPFQMYGELRLVRKGKDWQLQSLRLDKSLPSEEELDELREAYEVGLPSIAPD